MYTKACTRRNAFPGYLRIFYVLEMRKFKSLESLVKFNGFFLYLTFFHHRSLVFDEKTIHFFVQLFSSVNALRHMPFHLIFFVIVGIVVFLRNLN